MITSNDITTPVSFLLCIVVAASYIPQLVKSWKSKKTSDLSYVFLVIQSFEDLIVCIYAWVNSDTILFIGGLFSLALIYSLLLYKISLDGLKNTQILHRHISSKTNLIKKRRLKHRIRH